MNIGIAIGIPFFNTKNKLIAFDYFNRADGSLGNADSKQSWQILNGTPSIKSNKYSTTNSMEADNMAIIETGKSDVSIRAILNNSGSSFGSWIVFRAISYSSCWFVRVNNAGALQVCKYISAAVTVVGSYTGSYSNTSDNAVEVVLNGNSIRVFINGIERINISDSYNVTATQHGLCITNSTVNADNFEVKTL